MILNIIIIFLILLIIYKISKKKEDFNNSDIDLTYEEFNNYYNNQIKYINNIFDYINSYNKNNSNIIINSNDIKTNTINTNKLEIHNHMKIPNLHVKGNLTFSSNLIIDKNAKNNIIPRYTIIAWYPKYKYLDAEYMSTIPKGWVLCDGKKYYLDNNNFKLYDPSISVMGEIIETPNLVNKMIVGVNPNTYETSDKVIDKKDFMTYKGSDFYKLTSNDIPKHSHNYSSSWLYNKNLPTDWLTEWENYTLSSQDDYGIATGLVIPYNYGETPNTIVKTDYSGNNDPTPIDRKQPYIKLFYIMKL
jgi:hypothetical protein